uniref:Uncharacterized protein n=1 Tax=uncultured alpha proteobacterium HF0010_13E22 TaxID=710801 RepID=E0XR19_9PROT|nr:hypothetical protein [uncultured alpha proteobacterium HF0010_13E22]
MIFARIAPPARPGISDVWHDVRPGGPPPRAAPLLSPRCRDRRRYAGCGRRARYIPRRSGRKS